MRDQYYQRLLGLAKAVVEKKRVLKAKIENRGRLFRIASSGKASQFGVLGDLQGQWLAATGVRRQETGGRKQGNRIRLTGMEANKRGGVP